MALQLTIRTQPYAIYNTYDAITWEEWEMLTSFFPDFTGKNISNKQVVAKGKSFLIFQSLRAFYDDK